MNISEEYFWKANMALQTNRFNEAFTFLCQAIEQIDRTHLTLEEVELIWSIIPKIVINQKTSIERLVSYHRSMPIETDELFDRLTQSYVNRLEEDRANICLKLIDYFDRYLIQEQHDIDHIHLKRLQADLYLQLADVSRPYQCRLYLNKHRKILTDNEHIINAYRNRS